MTFFTLKIKNHIKNLELDKKFQFNFNFTSTLKLEKKIGGPSTFYLKLVKERREGERFHRDIKEMEKRYKTRQDVNMFADCCWSFKRENI